MFGLNKNMKIELVLWKPKEDGKKITDTDFLYANMMNTQRVCVCDM